MHLSYTSHVGKFADFIGKPLDRVAPEDIHSFQLYMTKERKLGWSSFNQAVYGLRFLYRVTISGSWELLGALLPLAGGG